MLDNVYLSAAVIFTLITVLVTLCYLLSNGVATLCTDRLFEAERNRARRKPLSKQ